MKTSILSTSELEWLTCKKRVSKVYEYRIISDIKTKLKIFQQLELPLLAQNGFLNELSVFTQKMSANTQIPNSMIYCHSTETDNCKNITSSLRRSHIVEITLIKITIQIRMGGPVV